MNIAKYALLFFCIFVLIVLPLHSYDLGKENLAGIDYLKIAVQFNGIEYYEGYVERTEEKVEEFNLNSIEKNLKETGLPLKKEYIRNLYKQLQFSLTEAGINVLKEKTYTGESGTVIPTLTIQIDTISTDDEVYFTVVALHVTKQLSNWAGGKRINAPVFIWYQKELAIVSQGSEPKTSDISHQSDEPNNHENPIVESDSLLETIDTAVIDLTGKFIRQLHGANGITTKKKKRVNQKDAQQ